MIYPCLGNFKMVGQELNKMDKKFDISNSKASEDFIKYVADRNPYTLHVTIIE